MGIAPRSSDCCSDCAAAAERPLFVCVLGAKVVPTGAGRLRRRGGPAACALGGVLVDAIGFSSSEECGSARPTAPLLELVKVSIGWRLPSLARGKRDTGRHVAASRYGLPRDRFAPPASSCRAIGLATIHKSSSRPVAVPAEDRICPRASAPLAETRACSTACSAGVIPMQRHLAAGDSHRLSGGRRRARDWANSIASDTPLVGRAARALSQKARVPAASRRGQRSPCPLTPPFRW